MITYNELQGNRRKFLALTGLTVTEFQQLLPAFTRSYEALFSTEQTLAGRPRQRFPGGGCHGVLHRPEQKLLFILIYLKTYPWTSPRVVDNQLRVYTHPRRSSMAKSRRTYTPEFKTEAVKLVTEQGYSVAEA